MFCARLLGGIRNKAARGELRRGLPVGFVWGEEDGEVRRARYEAQRSVLRPPRFIAGSTMALSPASNSLMELPGAFGSPPTCARASKKKLLSVISPCTK